MPRQHDVLQWCNVVTVNVIYATRLMKTLLLNFMALLRQQGVGTQIH